MLHKWSEFYAKDDSIYRTDFRVLTEDSVYNQDPEAFMARSSAKLRKYIPDLEQIVPDGLTSLRLDFDFALEHALEIFGRGKEKFKRILSNV